MTPPIQYADNGVQGQCFRNACTIPTHPHTHTCIHVHKCTHTCMPTQIHISIHAYAHIYTEAHTNSHACASTPTHMCVHTSQGTHTCRCTQQHICTQKHKFSGTSSIHVLTHRSTHPSATSVYTGACQHTQHACAHAQAFIGGLNGTGAAPVQGKDTR